MNKIVIEDIVSYELIDSRGYPTVATKVIASNGMMGEGLVPSGMSVGKYEAFELRDQDMNIYRGRGVSKAVNNINTIIKKKLLNFDLGNQRLLDEKLCSLDGTNNKSDLGANAILSTSIALARVSAQVQNMPLYNYLCTEPVDKFVLPIPMMNIINGGSHANNGLQIQEFMIMPVMAKSFAEAIKIGIEIFYQLKENLAIRNLSTSVGDEGGFVASFDDNREVLDLIVSAIKDSGYELGTQVSIALDVAASEFYKDGYYNFASKKMTAKQMVEYYLDLCNSYNIISIEDGCAEDDWQGWHVLTSALGGKINLVGDDIFVTNLKRLHRGVENKIANSVLIKMNQIGSVTETIDVMNYSKQSNYNNIVSHRSGDTEDSFIADLCVSQNSLYIKTGAPCRSERVAKYNRLLRIEHEIGADKSVYAGQLL